MPVKRINYNNPVRVDREAVADYLLEIVKKACDGMDSVYEDYIEHLVGVLGLHILREFNLIESCGVINGRQLYVLVDKKGK